MGNSGPQHAVQNRSSSIANYVTVMMAQNVQNMKKEFDIDSGAFVHMTTELKFLPEVFRIEPRVTLPGDISPVEVSHTG